MKQKMTATFWLIVCGLNLSAQDSLLYKNGSKVETKILEVQAGNQLVIFISDGDTLMAPFGAVENLYYEGRWQKPASIGLKPDEIIRHPFVFSNTKNFTPQPFSVSFNLFSYMFAMDNWNYRREVFADNRTLCFDAEWRVHPKLSVRIPLVIGLEVNSFNEEITNLYNPYSGYSSLQGEFWSFIVSQENPMELDVYSSGYSYYGSNLDAPHERMLIFQGGLGLKWFPFGLSRNEFYIGQQVSVGQADYGSVDYFYDFDTVQNPSSVPNWAIVRERAVVQPNKFLYFRYEALVGLSCHLGKSLSFTYETGFTTLLKNNGPKEDRVYIKTFDSEYELDYAENYQSAYNTKPSYYGYTLGQFNLISGFFVNRITVSFRFGSKWMK